MIYRIRHQTIYTYAEPVSLCHNLLHLLPRNVPRQACRFSQLPGAAAARRRAELLRLLRQPAPRSSPSRSRTAS